MQALRQAEGSGLGLSFDTMLGRRIIRLASPVMLAMLTQTALNLVDTIMVGWLPANYSIAGQSAIAYSLILLWAVGGFLSSIQVGTQAIAARRFGEGHLELSGRALTNSLILALTSGTVLSIVFYLLMPSIFPFFSTNASVVDLGVEYSQYRMLGVLSMVATVSYKSFFDGIGKTHVHMVAAIVMNIANLVLNYVLIFGIGPFPQMNVAGAGLGSLISTYIGLFVMVGWSFFPKYTRIFRHYRWRNLNPTVSFEIVRLSVPSGLATVFVMSGFGMFLKIVGMLDARASLSVIAHIPVYTENGVAALQAVAAVPTAADPYLHVALNRPPIFTAATKVIIDIMSVSFMTMIAFGTATATLVGQSLGEKRPELAERYGWESAKIGAALMCITGAAAALFPGFFIGLFNPDAQVIEAGKNALRMMGAGNVFIAVGLILAQALFGAGNSKFVMWAEMLLHFLCLIPISYLFGIVLELGLLGVWAAALLYIVLLACVMSWKFAKGEWKHIKL